MTKISFFAAVILLTFSGVVHSQTRVNVRFARGASSAAVSGSVTGYRYVDYRVGARAGQTMSVRIATKSPYASFVIFDGQMQNVEGADEQTDWSDTLPSDGTYTIRVLLPRSAARRGTSASYSLRITIR